MATPPSDRLILFTRYPLPGKAKTRLIPALGAAGAAALQRQMTEHTLAQVEVLLARSPVGVEIWYAASPAAATAATAADDRLQMQQWLGATWSYRAQGTGDLGARMAQAFQTAFISGAERVVTIGTDCPEVNADRLAQAFQQLQTHDLVLGPAIDGGYYLIGLRRFVPELFVGIAWSTETVLQQTIDIAQRLNLTIAQLDTLADVDRPEDLPVWYAASRSASIAVIVPVLNEAATIQPLLQSLPPQLEVIVVDGGSYDGTIEQAKALGATIVSSAPGRAQQMNAGAKAATADILLFLHADTRLPANFVSLVQQTLAQPGTAAGAFELQIAGSQPGLRVVEWGVNWRSRWLQLPYGDQAIFLRAATFKRVGGFAELPIMEDFDFVRRLQAEGKVAIAPAAVVTSGRRWQALGVLKTTLINQLVILGYLLGVSPARLAQWYRLKKR